MSTLDLFPFVSPKGLRYEASKPVQVVYQISLGQEWYNLNKIVHLMEWPDFVGVIPSSSEQMSTAECIDEMRRTIASHVESWSGVIDHTIMRLAEIGVVVTKPNGSVIIDYNTYTQNIMCDEYWGGDRYWRYGKR